MIGENWVKILCDYLLPKIISWGTQIMQLLRTLLQMSNDYYLNLRPGRWKDYSSKREIKVKANENDWFTSRFFRLSSLQIANCMKQIENSYLLKVDLTEGLPSQHAYGIISLPLSLKWKWLIGFLPPPHMLSKVWNHLNVGNICCL